MKHPDERRIRTIIYLPSLLKKQAKAYCKERFMSLSGLISRLLQKELIEQVAIWGVIGLIGFGIYGFYKSPSEYKCSDFKTQKEAQRFFEKYEAKQLDRDGDKISCEHLPY